MRRTRRLSLAFLCAVPVALGGGAAAHANAFDTVLNGYKKDGVINPCKYSSTVLKQAKAGITNDTDAYAPDFRDLVDAALKARASGACDKKQATGAATGAAPAGGAPSAGTGGTPSAGAAPATPAATTPSAPATPAATTAAAAPTPQPAPSVKPAPAVADGAILAAAANTSGDNGVPAPLIALAVLLALAALASATVLATRFLALEPRWLVRSRHATAEAGWRTSAAWAEFADWLRLGR